MSALDSAIAGIDAGDTSPEPERAAAAAIPLDSSRESSPATPYKVDEPAAPAKRERSRERSTLTGRAVASMRRSELETALTISERQNAELKEKLDAAAPAGVVKGAALERMCGVVVSALFDLAALATSVDEVRLDDDEERELGELGAPAIGPYIGRYAEHAPILAFGAKLATVITTKVLEVKAAKATPAVAPAKDGR